MQLWRFMKCLFFVTVVALIYIHMQMNIFSLAYEGKQKERHITRLREHNGWVSHDIFELKSANYIGQKMLNHDAKLKFCDEQSVIQITTMKPGSDSNQLASYDTDKANPLTKILSWRFFGGEAQAKDDQPVKPWQRGQH